MTGRSGLGMAVALAGLGVLILAGPLLRGQVLYKAASRQEETLAPVAENVAPAIVPQPAILQPPARSRPVAPQLIAPLPVEHDNLERIDAREPLSPIGRAHVPSEGAPQEKILHQPAVTEAGAFEAMGYHIRLPGLLVVPSERVCGDGDAIWPCGTHARTAFRNWLRGRALACTVPPVASPELVVSPCHLGGLDAGAWLVSQGWALADPADSRYEALENEAISARRGLHGTGPAQLAPLTVTLPQAVKDTALPADGGSGG